MGNIQKLKVGHLEIYGGWGILSVIFCGFVKRNDDKYTDIGLDEVFGE